MAVPRFTPHTAPLAGAAINGPGCRSTPVLGDGQSHHTRCQPLQFDGNRTTSPSFFERYAPDPPSKIQRRGNRLIYSRSGTCASSRDPCHTTGILQSVALLQDAAARRYDKEACRPMRHRVSPSLLFLGQMGSLWLDSGAVNLLSPRTRSVGCPGLSRQAGFW